MKAFWKAKLISLINEASDFESLKAGLLETLTGEKGPGEASSQGKVAAPTAPTTGLTRKDFVKIPPPVKAKAGTQRKAGKDSVPVSKLGKGAVAEKISNKAGTLPVPAKCSQKTGANPASMTANDPSGSRGQSTPMDSTDSSQPGPSGMATDDVASGCPEESNSGVDNDSDEESFEVYQDRKRRRTMKKGSSAPNNEPQRPVKVRPLVLEGLSKTEVDNPLEIRKLLKEADTDVVKTLKTKRGKILVFAGSDEAKTRLQKMTLRSGVSLRQTKDPTSRDNNFVIILGVNPTIDDKDISNELQRSCKRIVSAKQRGAATWKVKLQCNSKEEKRSLLSSGISIGLTRFKVTDYTTKQGVLQCYKCQGFSHISASCTNETKCQKCGQEHSSKDCESNELKCANCGGDHMASSFDCPRYAQEEVKKDTTAVTYASMVKKGGDQTDCLRLACSMARTMHTIVNHRLKMSINTSDICKDIAQNVAFFYKVNVRPEHVLAVAFASKMTQGSQVAN